MRGVDPRFWRGARLMHTFTLIDTFLVAAPLVVIPAARALLPVDRFPPAAIVFGAALCFAAAFLFAHAGAAALLTLPWLAVAAWTAARIAIDAWLARVWTLDALALVAAHAFLVIGAFFACASRAGWVVTGIYEPIVELTGVHFHYAGFATMVLALCVARTTTVPRAAVVVMLGVGIVAPPVVAAGFEWRRALLQIGGATLMTVFAWSVAALTILYIVRTSPYPARVLLVVSSLAVLAPMVLAVMWAAAQYYDVRALTIPQMARVHGTVNALGFVGCGIAGWRLRYADLRSSTTRAQRSGSERYGA
jgi:hypothetical protein